MQLRSKCDIVSTHNYILRNMNSKTSRQKPFLSKLIYQNPGLNLNRMSFVKCKVTKTARKIQADLPK